MSSDNPFRESRLNNSKNFRPEWDVPELNQDITRTLVAEVSRLRGRKEPDPGQMILFVTGPPGYGKTHLFGRIEHLVGHEVFFVFVPAFEVETTPIDHIRWHVVEALFRIPEGGNSQLEMALCASAGPRSRTTSPTFHRLWRPGMRRCIDVSATRPRPSSKSFTKRKPWGPSASWPTLSSRSCRKMRVSSEPLPLAGPLRLGRPLRNAGSRAKTCPMLSARHSALKKMVRPLFKSFSRSRPCSNIIDPWSSVAIKSKGSYKATVSSRSIGLSHP